MRTSTCRTRRSGRAPIARRGRLYRGHGLSGRFRRSERKVEHRGSYGCSSPRTVVRHSDGTGLEEVRGRSSGVSGFAGGPGACMCSDILASLRPPGVFEVYCDPPPPFATRESSGGHAVNENEIARLVQESARGSCTRGQFIRGAVAAGLSVPAAAALLAACWAAPARSRTTSSPRRWTPQSPPNSSSRTV